MRILVTNDDGIWAEGLNKLALELSKEHEIIVVAPSNEQSGVGHGFTFLTPLLLVCREEFSYPAFSLNGTPVDCVKLGAFKLFEGKPDMVVSGINCGGNLGTDVLYSGTASAAMEGAILGIPSLAVSCDARKPFNYEAAAKIAANVVKYMVENPLPKEMMLNLNVPDIPINEVDGIKLTNLARMHYLNSYEERIDPRGREYFWLTGDRKDGSNESDDNYWIKHKYATLTPVSIDLTAHEYLKSMKDCGYFN